MSTVGSLVGRPRAADCFEVREGQRRFGCRAAATADPRTVLGAWLEYAAGYSVVDLSLAECDEIYGQMRYEVDRTGPFSGLWRGRRSPSDTGAWLVPGEAIDLVIDRVAAHDASRARQLAAAA